MQMPQKPVEVVQGVKNAKAKAKELMSMVQNQKCIDHFDGALTAIRFMIVYAYAGSDAFSNE